MYCPKSSLQCSPEVGSAAANELFLYMQFTNPAASDLTIYAFLQTHFLSTLLTPSQS